MQNTNWKNVEKSIANLKLEGVLTIPGIFGLSITELEQLIRPSGYFRVKSRRIRNLTEHLVSNFESSLDNLFAIGLTEARESLLSISGIGPETADAILLYAGGLPSFVADTYAYRVLARHGWLEADAGYYDIKQYFEDRLPQDSALYNEFHALFVQLGKTFCKTKPLCSGCPLEHLLPPGGPGC